MSSQIHNKLKIFGDEYVVCNLFKKIYSYKTLIHLNKIISMPETIKDYNPKALHLETIRKFLKNKEYRNIKTYIEKNNKQLTDDLFENAFLLWSQEKYNFIYARNQYIYED